MYDIKYLVFTILLIILCSNCRSPIPEYRDYYTQSSDKQNEKVMNQNKPIRFLDSICVDCYRLMPSNHQKFYKKKK